MTRKQTVKPVPTKTKLKKDPGVPKLPDLKLRKSIQKQHHLALQAQNASRKQEDAQMASEPTLSSLALLAESTAASSSNDDLMQDPSSDSGKAQLIKKHYIRTLHKVIDESDIVVLVLDARDPEGCRSRLVEEEVRRREQEGKKLVFVLNKIDLVPRSNAEAWLRYLRHSTPTLPFRSSTQQQRSHLTSHTAPALLNLLKGYKQTHSSITVGVVGYPNVGKSSLINSLRRAKVCAVAAEAGHTKEMQSVQIDRGVRILDSPGVVFDADDQEAQNILLRNVLKVEDIQDPIAVVEQICIRATCEKLQKIYNLPEFTSTLEFLTMLALSSGRLLKGGTPDILAASRQVIQDWNSQKIPYHSLPPTIHPSSVPATITSETSAKYGLNSTIAPGAEGVGSAEIVNSFAPAFSLEGLFDQADSGAFGDVGGDEMVVEAEGIQEEQEQEALPMEDETAIMQSDDLTPAVPRKRSRSPSLVPPTEVPRFTLFEPESPPVSKRLKRTEKSDVKTYDTAAHLNAVHGIASRNPLNRRSLKKDSRKARKAERRAARKGTRGMEVDDVGGGLDTEGVGLGDVFALMEGGVQPLSG